MKRCIKEEIVVEEVKHKGSAVKKVKHIILAIIIIFNCLILLGLLIIFVLIHKDSGRKEEVKIAEQNEYQTKAGEGTKYEIIDGKLQVLKVRQQRIFR